jgi:hypothetical protein
VENTAVLASPCEDTEGLVRKVALLKGELAEARRAREAVKEKFCKSADGMRWLVVSEKERRGQFKELSLLWARGFELCLAIVGPPWVRNCLLERMRATALWRACEASGGSVFYHGVSARVIAG